MKVGKDLVTNRWTVVLVNKTHTFSFDFQEGFPATTPYPGGIMEEESVLKMLHFLHQTLAEKEEEEKNEQSDVE